MNFWGWFLRGTGGEAGCQKYLEFWLLAHLIIGVFLALVVPVSLADAARTVLLPLAGIFIGLTFAWGGNAQALLQTSEIERLADEHEGGLEHYIYAFQANILMILISLMLWGLAGLEVFDNFWPTKNHTSCYLFVKIIVYSFSSLALRDCWNVVHGAHLLLEFRSKIRELDKRMDKADSPVSQQEADL